MAGERERISIQEAVELTGISLPTIYRRINAGEIRGIICIDGRGKHWEIYKSEIPKLMLKRRRRKDGFVTEELPALNASASAGSGPAAELKAESEGAAPAQPHPEPVFDVPAPAQTVSPSLGDNEVLKDKIEALTEENAVCREQLRQLKERCQELQAEIKELREELDGQRDDAAYWRGRWEEASVNFEALRQAMVAKNDDDQEEIWSLRDQVNDLQEQVSLSEEALAAERELRESSSVLPAQRGDTEYGERHSIAPEPVFPDIEADAGAEADGEDSGEYEYEDSEEAEGEESGEYEYEDSEEADGEESGDYEYDDSEEAEGEASGEYEYEDSEEAESEASGEYEYEDSEEAEGEKSGEYEYEDSEEAEGEESGEYEYEDSGEAEGEESGEYEYEASGEADVEEYADESSASGMIQEEAADRESQTSEEASGTSRVTKADMEAAEDGYAGGTVYPEPDFSVSLNAAEASSAAEEAAKRPAAEGDRSYLPEIKDAPAPRSAFHTAEMPAAMHASGERQPAVRKSIPPIPWD